MIRRFRARFAQSERKKISGSVQVPGGQGTSRPLPEKRCNANLVQPHQERVLMDVKDYLSQTGSKASSSANRSQGNEAELFSTKTGKAGIGPNLSANDTAA